MYIPLCFELLWSLGISGNVLRTLNAFFSHRNAIAAFNKMMDRIFGLYRAIADMFFDDMVEHKNHLTLIFSKNSLLIMPENMSSYKIHFLGRNVSKRNVQMDCSRVNAINSWKGLKTFHVHIF